MNNTIKKVKLIILLLLISILSLLSFMTLTGFLSAEHWVFDLFSQFRLQFLILLLLGGGLLALRKRRYSLIFLAVAVINLLEVSAIYFGGNKDQSIYPTVTIVSINLLGTNSEHSRVLEYLVDTEPDIVVFQEYNQRWHNWLSGALPQYTTQVPFPRENNFGIAIYSKITFEEIETHQFSEELPISLSGTFSLDGKRVKLVATHPYPAMGTERFKLRNKQLDELGKYIKEQKNEAILIGDFNSSSFSIPFKRLLETSNMMDSRKGFGLLPTWPTWSYVLLTAIDHCLITKGLAVKNRTTGDYTGSDHFPIFAEIGIKRK